MIYYCYQKTTEIMMNKEIREYLHKTLNEEDMKSVMKKGADAYDAKLDVELKKLNKLKKEIGLIGRMTKEGKAKAKQLEYQQAKVNQMKARSPEEKVAELDKFLGYTTEDNQPTAGMSLGAQLPGVGGSAFNTANPIGWQHGYRNMPEPRGRKFKVDDLDIEDVQITARNLGYESVPTEQAVAIIQKIYSDIGRWPPKGMAPDEHNKRWSMALEREVTNYF